MNHNKSTRISSVASSLAHAQKQKARLSKNDETALFAWLAKCPAIKRLTRILISFGGPIAASLTLTNWFFVAREAKLSSRSMEQVIASLGEKYPDESLNEAAALELSDD